MLFIKYISSILIVLTFSTCGFGQNVFNKRISVGPGFLETTSGVYVDNDTIIFCFGGDNIIDGIEYLVYGKIDMNGNLISTSIMDYFPNGVYSGIGNNSIQKKDNYYYTFNNYFNNNSALNPLIIKFDQNFDTVWTKKRNPNVNYTETLYMGFISEDSLITVGFSRRFDVDGDVFIRKSDTLGNIGWERYLGGSLEDRLFNAIQTSDNGFLITGFTKTGSTDNSFDGFAYKLDSLGLLEWEYFYRELNFDCPLYFEETPSGDYIGCGCETKFVESGINQKGVFSIKIDQDGDFIWKKDYIFPQGHDNTTESWQIEPTQDGNYIILAMHGQDNGYAGRGIALKINEDGDSLWYREYHNLLNYDAYNYATDIKILDDEGFLIVGFLHPLGIPDTGIQDMWLVKANCLGFDHEPIAAADWYADDNYTVILDNNSQYFGNCIINWGDVSSSYVYEGYDTLQSHTYAGEGPYQIEIIAEACGSYDTTFITVYPQLLSTPENELPTYISLFPNPANNQINIVLNQNNLKIDNITLYDMQGNIVSGVTVSYKAGFTNLETGTLPNGMYLVHVLLDNGESHTLRLNVIH